MTTARKTLGITLLILAISIPVAADKASDPASADRLTRLESSIEAHGAAWTTGDSAVYRLSADEKKQLLGASEPEVPGDARPLAERDPKLGDLPPRFTWDDFDGRNFITPARSQGDCGSCWAFAATGAVEALYAARGDLAADILDLSEQNLLSCSGGGDCGSGYVSDAMDYYAEIGAPDESCFPYEEDDRLSCTESCSDWESSAVRIDGWEWITYRDPVDTELLKQAIYRAPVAVHMAVYDDFYAYESGVYSHVEGSMMGHHAVVLVGWDNTLQAWRAKNSWGADWGEDGLFWIRWNDSEIGTWAIRPILDDAPRPEVDTDRVEMTLDLIGDDPEPSVVRVRNASGGSLHFRAVEAAGWLSVAADGGSSDGEWRSIELLPVATDDIRPGAYTATLWIETPGADSALTEVRVDLNVTIGNQNDVPPAGGDDEEADADASADDQPELDWLEDSAGCGR